MSDEEEIFDVLFNLMDAFRNDHGVCATHIILGHNVLRKIAQSGAFSYAGTLSECLIIESIAKIPIIGLKQVAAENPNLLTVGRLLEGNETEEQGDE